MTTYVAGLKLASDSKARRIPSSNLLQLLGTAPQESNPTSTAAVSFGVASLTLNENLLTPRTHNDAQPIHRLPPEVLTIIFKDSMNLWGGFPELYSRLPIAVRTLRALCSVCSHWYDIAKASPDLWTITCPSGWHGRESLAPHSKELPLTVVFSFSRTTNLYGQISNFKAIMSESLPRVKQLYLSNCNAFTPWAYLQSPAPLLESFSLELGSVNFPHIRRLGSRPNEIPQLFLGVTPMLQRLHLFYATRWMNDFNNLTHLCLMDQAKAGRYTLREFLTILSHSPHLEELKLQDAGPDALSLGITAHAKPLPNVFLNSLRVLELAKFNPSEYKLENLLDHLTVPSQCLRFIRPKGWLDTVPAGYFRGTPPTQDLVITTNNNFHGVVKRGSLMTVFLAPKYHHQAWRKAFNEGFMPAVSTVTSVYLDLPLDQLPWDAIRTLTSVEALHFLPRGDFYPLFNILRLPKSSQLNVKTVTVKKFDMDRLKAAEREDLVELYSKGSVTIARPEPCPPCQAVLEDSIEKPMYGYRIMGVADSFFPYSSIQDTAL
ncbi:hypothetical protein BKA70DRAFT_1267130, partial [Coprinopsis sp. MPI-PUGE-AT-0042]